MLLRPRWLLAHVLVLALAVAFAGLGLWQLRRLDDKQAANAHLRARSSQPVVPVSTLFPSASFDAEQVAAAAYRRVTVTGVYDPSEEVLLLSRSRNTLAGHHLLTPVVLQQGYAVVVDRGWVPFRGFDPPVAEALPPTGTATVTGVLFPTQVRGRFGPRDKPGELDGIWRIDIARLQQQSPRPLLPLWLLIESQEPRQTTELPKSIELPKLDEGPHRSYALQWFAFTLVVLVGYTVIVRNRIRAARREAADTL